MITSTSKFSSAELANQMFCTDGKINTVVGHDGVPRPNGLFAPPSAPTPTFAIGEGGMVPGVNYSWLYTYFNSLDNVESPAGPESQYDTLGTAGLFQTMRVGMETLVDLGDPELLEVWIVGNISHETGFYNNQTIAIKIVNNEYQNEYSEWQFRKVLDYVWDEDREIGIVTVNRKFFNVDPDPGEQRYDARFDTLECETGRVCGPSTKNTIVIETKEGGESYFLKMIVITSGQGKGQRRLIVGEAESFDLADPETGAVTEHTRLKVDTPWVKKPFYAEKYGTKKKVKGEPPPPPWGDKLYEEKTKDIETQREAKEKKGWTRDAKFYTQQYSSEYVICDPLTNDGLVKKGVVAGSNAKGDIPILLDKITVRLEGDNPTVIAKGGPSKAMGEEKGVGEIVKYEDKTNDIDDTVTISDVLDGSVVVGMWFRIEKGPGEGFKARIEKAEDVSDGTGKKPPQTKLTLSTYGTLQKRYKGKPSKASFWCIYGEKAITLDGSILPGTSSLKVCSTSDLTNPTTILIGDFASLPDGYNMAKGILPELGKPEWSGILTPVVDAGHPEYISTDKFVWAYDYDGNSPMSFSDDKYNGMMLYYNNCDLSIEILDYDGLTRTITTKEKVEKPGSDFGRYAIAKPASTNRFITMETQALNNASLKRTISRRILFAVDDGSHIWLKMADRFLTVRILDDPGDELTLRWRDDYFVPVDGSKYAIREEVLRDGFYTGWKIVFYITPTNTDVENGKDLKVKDLKKSSFTVVGWLDAFGAVMLDKSPGKLPDGTHYIMFSEYTRFVGSRLLQYYEDAVKEADQIDPHPIQSALNGRFFYLDWWASETNGEYEPWKIQILYGWAKKKSAKKTLVLTGLNRNFDFTVYQYTGDTHKIDVGYDTRIYPTPNGDEFVYVYDPTSSIYKLFDATLDSSSDDDTNPVVGQDAMYANVGGFVLPTQYGSDKIKLYRASENNKTYMLVSEILVSDLVSKGYYKDDHPVEFLGNPIDLGRANVAVAKYCCSHKERMAYAGGFVGTLNLELIKGIPIGHSVAASTNIPALRCHEGTALSLFCGSTPIKDRYKLFKVLPRCCIKLGNDDAYGSIRHTSILDHEGELKGKVYYFRGDESDKLTFSSGSTLIKIVAASSITVTLDPLTASKVDDYYNGYYLQISGTALQSRIIDYAYDPSLNKCTCTLEAAFETTPSPGTNCIIVKPCELQRETTAYHAGAIANWYGARLYEGTILGTGATTVVLLRNTIRSSPCAPDVATETSGNASDIDDYYVGLMLKDASGTAYAMITGYVAATATLTLGQALANGIQYTMVMYKPWKGENIKDLSVGGAYKYQLYGGDEVDNVYQNLYLRHEDDRVLITAYQGSGTVATVSAPLPAAPVTNISLEMHTKLIFLDDGASIADDFYNEELISINGQTATIKDYVGADRLAILYTAVYIPVSTVKSGCRIVKTKWRQNLAYTDGTWKSLCFGKYQTEVSSWDRLFFGIGSGSALIEYAGFWMLDDTGNAMMEYHAGTLAKTGLTQSTSPKGVLPDLRGSSASIDIYCSSFALLLKWKDCTASSSVILDRPFESSTGTYSAVDYDGKNAVQITSPTETEIVQMEGLLSIPSRDGDIVTGIVDVGGTLAIFQKYSIYIYDPDQFQLQLPSRDVGCVAQHTIRTGKMGVYWLASGGRIFRMNSKGDVVQINKALMPWFKGQGCDCAPYLVGDHPIDLGAEEQSCAVYDPKNDNYVIAMPRLDSGRNDYVDGLNSIVLVFNEESNRWTRLCYAKGTRNLGRIYSMFVRNGDIGFCCPNGLYLFFGSEASNFTGSSAIPWGFASNWMSYSNPEKRKLAKRIVISNTPPSSALPALVGTTATIRYQRDRSSEYIPDFQSVDGAAGRTISTVDPSILTHVGVRSMVWRFVITGNGFVNMSDINMNFRPKGDPAEAWGTQS